MKNKPTPPAANISFEFTAHFKKDIKALGKRHRSIGDDLDDLLAVLEEGPHRGTPLGQDCYKIRMVITSKQAGKSGGAFAQSLRYHTNDDSTNARDDSANARVRAAVRFPEDYLAD